jgi:hypothetical protein
MIPDEVRLAPNAGAPSFDRRNVTTPSRELRRVRKMSVRAASFGSSRGCIQFRKIVADALAADDPEALRRIRNAIEEVHGKERG